MIKYKLVSLMDFAVKFKSIFKKDNISKFILWIIPYIVLLIATLLPFWFWIVYPFMTGGDDYVTHLALVYDLVYGFKHGFFYSTNHIYYGIFAYDASLFYGMFPHYCSAIFNYLFSFTGIGVVSSIKIISIIFSFIAAIFAYKLVSHISKNKVVGIAGGIAYAFLPYRTFCFFYRFAFSEAIALTFIPMFFYALYRIINDEKLYISPFIILILSLAMCVFSHPFTAILIVLSGIIFCLFNIKKLFFKFKKLRFSLYMLTSVILEVGLVFCFVFPMLEAYGLEIYRVSDNEIMWTNLESVLGRMVQSFQFAGLLNFQWLEAFGISSPTDSTLLWTLGLIIFPFSCIGAFILDFFILKKLKVNIILKYIIRVLVLFIIVFIPSIAAFQRIEMYLALSLFFVSYIILFMIDWKKIFHKKEEEKESDDNPNIGKEYYDLLNDTNVYCCLLLIIVGMFYLFNAQIWEISPSFMYMGQFPFRFWGIVGFFIIFLLAIILRPLRKNKYVGPIAIAISCYLLTLNMSLVDKRLYSIPNESHQVVEANEEWVKTVTYFGAQNEYLPQIFYDIYEGKKDESYDNSLGYEVARYICTNRIKLFGIEEYIQPVYLDGSGKVEITYLNTPDANFEVVCNKEGLIQIPQIYYPGYNAVAVDENGNHYDLETSNVDGLVTFSIPKGSYDVYLTFPGNSLKNTGWGLLIFSSIGVVIFATYGYIDRKLKDKKSKNNCNLQEKRGKNADEQVYEDGN